MIHIHALGGDLNEKEREVGEGERDTLRERKRKIDTLREREREI